MNSFVQRQGWLLALFSLALLSGCTTAHYRKSADRETYGAIRQKSPLVRNTDRHFTIEQTNVISLAGLPVSTNVEEFLGPDGEQERGASILDLSNALDIAIHHSRSYQARKESLYLSALSLTLARHQFTPLFSASGNANYAVQTEQDTAVGIDEITGQPTVIVSDNLVEQANVNAAGSVGASWLIRDVGRISTAFTADFLRFVTGDTSVTSSSQLGATFLRPLLRDAGFKQEKEELIEAERQLLYDLRSFTQYRKDFSVQIATAYYGVLGSRDAARNTYLNFQSSKKNAERAAAMAEEGRTTTAELGRLAQQQYSSESAWIGAVRSYQEALDNFKLQLGMNVDDRVVLDDRELESLQIRHPHIAVEDSINVALAGRLDLMNTRDELDDTEREVKVAANMLGPQLDLGANVTVNSNPNGTSHFEFPELGRYQWNAGLTLDPGLDRKAERNSYRAAIIARNRASRSLDEEVDQIKIQVRDSWRTLDEARRNYEISDLGVKLAERRVEEQDLLAEVGRAKAQDQVDAENALIDSKNQRTQALVTHTIARLQFWNNLGILYIKDNGGWEERQDEKIK